MIRQIIDKEHGKLTWIDVCAPDQEELRQIAREYHLEEDSVQDCLQSDHLPKYENLESYIFIIFRVYNPTETMEADTVQELTNKVAFFLSNDYLITIHRKEQGFINDIAAANPQSKYQSVWQLFNVLLKGCLRSYEAPSTRLSKEIDYYEENIFLRNRKVPMLKGLYFLHRKIALIKRMLILSYDIIDNIDASKHRNISTRDTRDLYVRLQNVYDNLYDNVNQLLNVYFSTASQRTNEIMRVLTIFSVFFMPLTFVVGVYGMNFKFMPELDWKYGYPAVLLLMAVITLACYKWFKKQGWM